MYSILIRATLRAILVVLTVNARVDVKKHRATTKAKNILLKVDIARNVCYEVETIYHLRPTQQCWHEDGTMGTAVCCAVLCCAVLCVKRGSEGRKEGAKDPWMTYRSKDDVYKTSVEILNISITWIRPARKTEQFWSFVPSLLFLRFIFSLKM